MDCVGIVDKVIFLDIDGVVCLYPEWQQDWSGNQNDRLSELCCKNLKAILDSTGAKIVITSSWRLEEQDLTSLFAELERFAITSDYIVGQTIDLRSDKDIRTHNELRWAEIKDYIERSQIRDYVILDDFNLEKYDKAHLIRTKRHEGLTAKLRDICIEKLGKLSEKIDSDLIKLTFEHYGGNVSSGDRVSSNTEFVRDCGRVCLIESNAFAWHEGFDCDYDESMKTSVYLDYDNSTKLFAVLGLSDVNSKDKIEEVLLYNFKYGSNMFLSDLASNYSRESEIKSRIDDGRQYYEKYCSLVKKDDVVNYFLHKAKFKENKAEISSELVKLATDSAEYKKLELRSLHKFIVFCLRNKINFDMYCDYEMWPL